MYMDKEKIGIRINPIITPDELYEFYKSNDICEEGYGKEVASRVLKHSSLIVGAFLNNKLVGITRAMFDGLAAEIVEFCIAIKLQGKGLRYDNGSIIEKDNSTIGKQLGKVIIEELYKMGAFYISATVFEEVEKDFFLSIGFKKNEAHSNYVIDKRPYVVYG